MILLIGCPGPRQALRTATQLSIGPLQLPVYNGLARVLACSTASGHTWTTTSVACRTGSSLHAVALLFGIILLALFWVITFVGASLSRP